MTGLSEGTFSKCPICKIHVNDEDKLAICVNCDQKFHFDHLQVWLKKRSQCPNCKHIFSFEFMRKMRPYGNVAKKKKKKKPVQHNSRSSLAYQHQNRNNRDEETFESDKIGNFITIFSAFFFVFFLYAWIRSQ